MAWEWGKNSLFTRGRPGVENASLYTKIHVKSNHFFLTSPESPLNKGGSEVV